jgi:DNA-binding SARP family transcriptional activator
MSQLQMALLGAPVVKHGERTLTFSTRKALALLVYLAVEGGLHTRQTLSEALWPELDAEHGRAALRATLLELRKLLELSHAPGERTHLLVERDTLALEQNSSLLLDLRLVEALSKHIGRGVDPPAGQEREAWLAQLEQATRLARGPFLASFTLRDAQFFDDWTRQHREYWHLRVQQLFETLSSLYERAGDGQRAIETVSRWLGFDPLQEEGYRRLMRLRFAQGDRAGALRAFAACRDVLASDLQMEPEPQTLALAKLIRRTAPVRALPSGPAHPSPGQPPAHLLDSPLLGRSAEFGSLIESYQRVHAGEPHLVLLQGEAGIGKTRLASEFLGWTQAQGADVLAGRALPTGRQLPFLPLIDVLRPRLEQDQAPDDLLSDVWLAELARLLPELRDRSPDLPVLSTDEALGDSRLFEAVARLLQGWAARRPLVLVLDDLHWADTATLDLLLYLAQSLAAQPTPILLLLTLRTGADPFSDPQSSWVMALKRTRLALTTLALTPLTKEETQHFVQAFAWAEQQPEAGNTSSTDGCPENGESFTCLETLVSFADWLYVQTRGHPFYLTETLRGLLEREIIVPALQQHGTWELVLRPGLIEQTSAGELIPARVRELIRSQLGQLTPLAWALLVAGAVLREGLTFERLCQVAQLEEEAGLQALEELLRAGLLCEETLVEEGQVLEGYSFPGEMIREVVYRKAGATRQRLVQRRVSLVMQDEVEEDQGEQTRLPHRAPLDGHAPAEARKGQGRRAAATAASRGRRGMRWALAPDASGVLSRQIDTGRGEQRRLAAWEEDAAAQAASASPRSPPRSPA